MKDCLVVGRQVSRVLSGAVLLNHQTTERDVVGGRQLQPLGSGCDVKAELVVFRGTTN